MQEWVGDLSRTVGPPVPPVPEMPVPRIRPHLPERISKPRMVPERQRYPRMREVVFRVLSERPGHLEAQADTLPLRISAPSLEELQHEAREALIEHMGTAHCTVRVRVRRGPSAAVSSIRPVAETPLPCTTVRRRSLVLDPQGTRHLLVLP